MHGLSGHSPLPTTCPLAARAAAALGPVGRWDDPGLQGLPRRRGHGAAGRGGLAHLRQSRREWLDDGPENAAPGKCAVVRVVSALDCGRAMPVAGSGIAGVGLRALARARGEREHQAWVRWRKIMTRAPLAPPGMQSQWLAGILAMDASHPAVVMDHQFGVDS